MKKFLLFGALIAVVSCEEGQVQDFAENIDPLIPKIVTFDPPETVESNTALASLTFTAIFVPGAWAEEETPPTKGLEWAAVPPNANGSWPERTFVEATDCEQAGSAYPSTAQACRVRLVLDADQTVHARWRYVSSVEPQQDPGLTEPEPPFSVPVSVTEVTPPPPQTSSEAEITSLIVNPNPICKTSGGTDAEAIYAFDLNDTEINGNNRICAQLRINGNVVGGNAGQCWRNFLGPRILGEDPTEGIFSVELNDFFGGYSNLPASAEFELILSDAVTTYDTASVTRSINICN